MTVSMDKLEAEQILLAMIVQSKPWSEIVKLHKQTFYYEILDPLYEILLHPNTVTITCSNKDFSGCEVIITNTSLPFDNEVIEYLSLSDKDGIAGAIWYLKNKSIINDDNKSYSKYFRFTSKIRIVLKQQMSETLQELIQNWKIIT